MMVGMLLMFASLVTVVKHGKYYKMFNQHIILQIPIVLDTNLVKVVVSQVGVAQRQLTQHGLQQQYQSQLLIMVRKSLFVLRSLLTLVIVQLIITI